MRVIAGDFKGRRLTSLSGDNTRPTSDKIKGSIFNMIGPYFDEEKVLDLYSGSGNLAIEAVSRGCSKAYCFDNHFKAIQVIQENIKLTKSDSSFVVKKMDADRGSEWLHDNGQIFDLIFLDPAYAKQIIETQLEKMQELKLIAPFGRVICETDKQVDLPDTVGKLVALKQQSYGATKVTIYRLEEEEVEND